MLLRALTAVWLAGLLALLQMTTRQTQSAARQTHTLLSPAPFSQVSPRVVRILTLGYQPLYDDFITFWLVQSLADPALLKAEPAQIAALIKTTTRHEPKLESIYLLACFVAVYDVKHPEFCAWILGDGMQALPLSWSLPATAAFVATFIDQDLAKGSLYYGVAAQKPGAPAYMNSFSQKLAAKDQLTGSERDEALRSLLSKMPKNGGRPW